MLEQAPGWLTIETSTDDDQETDRFEEETAHALYAAARELHGRGWTPHDLANAVAEAVAPPPQPDHPEPEVDPFA